MDVPLDRVARNPLFNNIGRGEIEPMLSCLGSRKKRARKGNFLLSAGEPSSHIYLVLSGRVQIVRESADGGRQIVAEVGEGEIFGEAIACAGALSPVSALAQRDSTVLALDAARMTDCCQSACERHKTLSANLLRLIAQKNLYLNERIELLTKKTLHEKIMCFLRSREAARGSPFEIAFSREELADFLCVNRSALSRELARLQKEGLLEYRRNTFHIK